VAADTVEPSRGEVVGMRGRQDPQASMLAFVDLEMRVPLDHPLRMIKSLADEALADLSPLFDEMYAELGRPSIPPERLLKSSLLISLYSVRSEYAFCEELNYHLLFRWFLGMAMVEPSFDSSTFSKNRERLLKHQAAREFFDAAVRRATERDLLSDELFTVDGTLIQAAASPRASAPRTNHIGRTAERSWQSNRQLPRRASLEHDAPEHDRRRSAARHDRQRSRSPPGIRRSRADGEQMWLVGGFSAQPGKRHR
jgi:transposase